MKNFKVIPVDKNKWIFVGEAKTGKTFFANKIVNAKYFDVNNMDYINGIFREIDIFTYTMDIIPMIIFITNDEYLAKAIYEKIIIYNNVRDIESWDYQF